MNLRTICAVVLASVMGACGGGGSSAPPPPPPAPSGASLVATVPLSNVLALNGTGNAIVASTMDTTSTFKETLVIYRQDPAQPDLLVNAGTVYLGVDTLYHRVSSLDVNDQWAAVTINENFSTQGWVSLVSMAGPTYTLDRMLTLTGPLDRAVARDHWLVVAAGTSVGLYDITAPHAPVLSNTFTLDSPVTTLVAVGGGFMLVTHNGYVFLDPVASTVLAVPHADIKSSVKAYLVGSTLYIGGPSKFAGKSKVAKVDVSTPTAATVTMLNDMIDGAFADFAHDGAGGYFVQTANTVYRYVESAGGITLSQSAPFVGVGLGFSRFYAHRGRFYSTTIENGIPGALYVYRMP